MESNDPAPASAFDMNPWDHLRYAQMVKDLERASRDQLLELAKKMAYNLTVVEPSAKRLLIRSVTSRSGSAAEVAMAALGGQAEQT